jgi:glutaconate CoA-transferase subunit A
MAERTSKQVSLAEAARRVGDGARIALGGFSVYQHPMAFVRELIRQGRRDLTVVGVVNGPEVDMLAGAGALRRVESSYVGLEKYGLAPNFRRRVQDGKLEMVDYPELLSWDRFRASEQNQTFLPASFLGGTDVQRRNPDIKAFACPLTGRQLWAVPPADPEIAVIHAIMGDTYGNVLVPRRRLLPQNLDITLARSCDRIIVTVERIVSNDEVRRHAELNQIPSYRVECIAEAPWGAHPCPVLGFSRIDEDAFNDYVSAAKSDDGFRAYLERTVHDLADHDAYLRAVGIERLTALQTTMALQ